MNIPESKLITQEEFNKLLEWHFKDKGEEKLNWFSKKLLRWGIRKQLLARYTVIN